MIAFLYTVTELSMSVMSQSRQSCLLVLASLQAYMHGFILYYYYTSLIDEDISDHPVMKH